MARGLDVIKLAALTIGAVLTVSLRIEVNVTDTDAEPFLSLCIRTPLLVVAIHPAGYGLRLESRMDRPGRYRRSDRYPGYLGSFLGHPMRHGHIHKGTYLGT